MADSKVLMSKGAEARAFDDSMLEQHEVLPDKQYNVTSTDEAIVLLVFMPCLGWNSTTLILDDQEATLKSKNLCCTSVQKRPYAHLGDVTVIQKCGGQCGATLASDMAPVNEKGEGGLSPGCSCCNEARVRELADDLQRRKELRGSIAQIQKLDYLYNQILGIRERLVPILNQKDANYDELLPIVQDNPEVRPDQNYDMTNNWELCTTTSLALTPEEAVLKRDDCCACTQIEQKREYAQLGNVNRYKACVCCVGVTSELGLLSPGCGCDRSRVAEVVEELQLRMITRGNMGQIRKQELMLEQMGELLRQINALHAAVGATYPPSTDVMDRAFEGGKEPVPNEGSGAWKITQVEEKSYVITDNCQNLCKICCTLGLSGWGSDKVDLEKDSLYLVEKDNFDDSRMKMPYAQLISVDYSRDCCCCYRVNFAQPGWGCERELVQELAEELQNRKIERGNVAQIRQLEALDKSSREIQFKLAATLEKLALDFPPSEDVVASLYNGSPAPKAMTMQRPHVEPSKSFETKHFDVSNNWESACTCIFTLGMAGPCTKQEIELEAEEMVKTTNNWCQSSTQRTPYGQLGSVDVESAFGCCKSIPDVGSAGCGCEVELMDELAADLQERKVKRGNIAQIKIKENVMTAVLKTKTMLDVLEGSKSAS